MPSRTLKQHIAMQIAAAGKSNLGIPKSVGKEFTAADKAKGKFQGKSTNEAIVTHVPHKNEYWVHEPKQEPKPEGIFKYNDAEDRAKAKSKAHKHAGVSESVMTFSEYISEAEEGKSTSNEHYGQAYEISTALHLHHLTGSKDNKDKAHQERMTSLHEKGRAAFDKLPEHLKHRALEAGHKSAKAYLDSLEKNHDIKAKDIEEVQHTSKGIGHLVGGDAPQNKNPHDVVVKTKKGELHGASLKATARTASNNTPSIVPGLPGVYEKGLKRAGLEGKSTAEKKAVRSKPEMIANAQKTQHEAAAHHTKAFNEMKPSEQKEHVQHLIRHNPDTKIPLDYVNGQKGTSTPYEQLPHVAKTLAAKHFVAKHTKGSNLVKIHAVHADGSEHHIATVEHRYTHGPHVSPQVNAKLSTMK